jgi:hypothetical protein
LNKDDSPIRTAGIATVVRDISEEKEQRQNMVSLDGRQKIASKRMLAGLVPDHIMLNGPRNKNVN